MTPPDAYSELAQAPTEGVRLQVSFGEETARIYLWQIVRPVA